MNCRNAFQIYLNIENRMTNRASLQVLKKRDIHIERLRGFDVGLSVFFKLINHSDQFLGSMGNRDIIILTFYPLFSEINAKSRIPMAYNFVAFNKA